MRISAIGQWATCEVQALTAPKAEFRIGAAAWVGTLAHAHLAGLPDPVAPKRIAFDEYTPSKHIATVQAHSIARKAREILSDQGWLVVAQEKAVALHGIEGHMDVQAWHRTHGEAVIDLKTGRGIGAAWLQVGGYIMAGGVTGTGDESRLLFQSGGILHVPRVRIHQDEKGTLEIRPATSLVLAWDRALTRIEEVVQAGAPATYSPGRHCGYCRVSDCPVRP